MNEDRSGIFATLPDNFFSPLASPNRVHYAALLGIFWRTFQEFPRGVERSVLMSRFAEYFSLCREQVADEELDLGEEEEAQDEGLSIEPTRAQAARFLRNLIAAGWMANEDLEDYTRMVNLTAWSRPFYEALARTEEGRSTEYESHIVAIYSLLCSDAAEENGHYAVLNAHESTVALNDSLKVLLQGIKDHYERLTPVSEEGSIALLLHHHYDLYAADILDGAYKRLKTSDNLSRYRPRILKRVQELRLNDEWLTVSAGKYARTARMSLEEARDRIKIMLQEIRDVLKGLDPLLAEIDRRNMQYARVSAERIQLLLAPDSSIAGRLSRIARGIAETPELAAAFSHHLYRVSTLSPESRFRRWQKEAIEADFSDASQVDLAEFERIEAELRERLERQLNPERVGAWLDGHGGEAGPLAASSLLDDTLASWVSLLHAVSYAESRPESFGYSVAMEKGKRIQIGEYDLPDLLLRRKK
ncbi:MAG TPA: hypothetical protein GXZ47_02100 [Treponema sp.]|nr:hypothetical protein [Treponema sp.]